MRDGKQEKSDNSPAGGNVIWQSSLSARSVFGQQNQIGADLF